MGNLLKASFFPDGFKMPTLAPSPTIQEDTAEVDPQDKIVPGRDDMPTEVTPSSEATTDIMGNVKILKRQMAILLHQIHLPLELD